MKKIKKMKIKIFNYIFWSYSPIFPVLWSNWSINLKILIFLSLEVGLSVTTTNDGLLDDALINPQDPSLNENLTPLTVNMSSISWLSIFYFSFWIFFILLIMSSTTSYFSSSLQKGDIVGDW